MNMRTTLASVGAVMALGVAAVASAQDQEVKTTSTLNLPDNPTLFGSAIPDIVKATAIVNGEVVTQTDVNQRLMLLVMANGGEIPADELERVRQQVLRNIIDETLQIQAAESAEITVSDADIDRTLRRVAENMKMTPDQLGTVLQQNGSSIQTMRRQIRGEIAWQRLQARKIESGVSVADDEVKAVIDRMEAAKGSDEYRVGEIFLSATSADQAQAMANANQILEQLRKGASFVAYARQFSEASTAAVGGDLGWVRPEQLPPELATVVRAMSPGQVSNPIALPGGVSIIAVQDQRKVLSSDPRDAVMSLKQVSITFPPGMTRTQAEPIVARFTEAARNIGGCGGADRIASEFNAEVVESDGVKMRDLPLPLQQIMIPMQVGQATQPFGSFEDGVRILVMCGRDEVDATMPTYDQVLAQMNEERVNKRARRYLRDLRRDAVIDFR